MQICMRIYENYDFNDAKNLVSDFVWDEKTDYGNILSAFILMLKIRGNFTAEAKFVDDHTTKILKASTENDIFKGKDMAELFNSICESLGLVA